MLFNPQTNSIGIYGVGGLNPLARDSAWDRDGVCHGQLVTALYINNIRRRQKLARQSRPRSSLARK